jgi:hypothetical protein
VENEEEPQLIYREETAVEKALPKETEDAVTA